MFVIGVNIISSILAGEINTSNLLSGDFWNEVSNVNPRLPS